MIKIKRFYKKVTAIALATAMMLTLCACGKDAGDDVDSGKHNATKGNYTANVLTDDVGEVSVEERKPEDEFVAVTADFAINVFKTSVAQDIAEGKNVLISPESISCALTMTANGAKDETLLEMEQVLTGGMDINQYNEYLYTYNNKLTSSEDVEFHMANSIWVMDDEERIKMKEEFLSTCGNYYNADVFMAPFDETTVVDINNWVSDNTNDMIQKLLDEIPYEAVIYLINAIAFEGTWEDEYEDNQVQEDGKFTNYAGVKQNVTMLNSTESLYICDENATGFVKYYEGRDYAFMAILPNDEDGLADYIDNMTGDDYVDMYNNREYCDVIVKMPEFTYEYDTELSEYLKEMGMKLPFAPEANFENMADTETGLLYINRVIHKTFIQVDRKGTKAAAVTSVEMKDACASVDMEMPKEVILDRPFVYAIIDVETGLPVFMGAVNTIE
ncbi:MAG: proteinase inhibitor I4 serpin [Lachnospiraceae bacterium]|nr:proteinase inhibitor I4 serpin [Lachnospiraceae bacterium]